MIGRGLHPLLPWPVPGPRPAPTLSADRDGQGHRIMVLRHQVLVLERQLNARVAYRPVDRAILAALSRLLARWRWRSFLVTPETLLCWHRELSRRKWRRWRSTRGPGRPPINDELVELIVRIARENRRRRHGLGPAPRSRRLGGSFSPRRPRASSPRTSSPSTPCTSPSSMCSSSSS
jgi:hypothetical protein